MCHWSDFPPYETEEAPAAETVTACVRGGETNQWCETHRDVFETAASDACMEVSPPAVWNPDGSPSVFTRQFFGLS